MRQLWFVEPGRLEWREVAPARIESPRDALVRPLAVATCDLDVAILDGRAPLAGPFPFGHETVAEVVNVGGGVRIARRGDRVIVPFQISCGDCDNCLRGLTANCLSVPPRSSYGLGALGGAWGSAFSDLVRVPFADAMLVRVPSGQPSSAVASLSDNVPDGWRTVAPHLQQRPGAPVLILGGGGSGSIGLYAAGVAVALGSSRIDYADSDRARLAIAASLGAHPIDVKTWPHRLDSTYPITVDATADKSGLACAIRSTEPGGVCTSTGIYFEAETPVPLLEMYGVGMTFITGRVHARAAMESILELIEDGRFRPEKVTTQTARWEEALEALMNVTTKLVIERE